MKPRAVRTIKEEGLSDDGFTATTLTVVAHPGPTLAYIYLNTQGKSKRRQFLLSNIEKFKKEN